MAYMSGAHSGSIRGAAYGTSGDVYFQSARIESSSQLAQLTAPPYRPRFRDGVMQVGIVFGIIGFFASYFVVYLIYPALLELRQLFEFGQKLSPVAENEFKFLCYLLLPFAASSGILIMSALLRVSGYRKATASYQTSLAQWRRSALCLRCGQTWLR